MLEGTTVAASVFWPAALSALRRCTPKPAGLGLLEPLAAPRPLAYPAVAAVDPLRACRLPGMTCEERGTLRLRSEAPASAPADMYPPLSGPNDEGP